MPVMVLRAVFHAHFCRVNGLAGHCLRGNFPFVQMQLAQLGLEAREFEPGVNESAQHHVSADSGEAIEISQCHFEFGETVREPSERRFSAFRAEMRTNDSKMCWKRCQTAENCATLDLMRSGTIARRSRTDFSHPARPTARSVSPTIAQSAARRL